MDYCLELKNISKKFHHGYIFKNVSCKICSGECLTISGRNGAGKTTLLKIISGIIMADKGNTIIKKDKKNIDGMKLGLIGYLGPYLELYDKLSAKENLRFFATQLRVKISNDEVFKINEKIGLKGREDDMVESYSSGMKQRLKYGLLYLKKFPIILLDEPTANFDKDGKTLFKNFIKENKNSIVIIASNEEEEIKLGDFNIELS